MGAIRTARGLSAHNGSDRQSVLGRNASGFTSFVPGLLRLIPLLAVLVSVLIGGLLPAWGQSENAAHPFSSTTQWTLWFGGGPSIPTGSVSYRSVGFIALSYSTPLRFWWFGQRDGLFDGFWEYRSELPLYAVFENKTALGIGYTPIGFRYIMRAHRRIRPFVGGLAGMLYASERIPDGAAQYNFSPQAEFGVSVGNSVHGSWSVEARYVHISDAGLHHPNPGINSVLILAGYTF